ncbi:MAG: sodium pump decarboxylase gamma subunit [Eubacteriales bacterium]|nr:sodium pump decarboxylase gamma subunit [Eubacteriales bacterium]
MSEQMFNFMAALDIMWKGMLGIFTASLVIILAVVILEKVTNRKK